MSHFINITLNLVAVAQANELIHPPNENA